MKSEIVLTVIKKLIGNINPVGETVEDHIRLENLKTLCEVVNELVSDIDHVSYQYKDRVEYSIKESQQFAEQFLTKTLGIS